MYHPSKCFALQRTTISIVTTNGARLRRRFKPHITMRRHGKIGVALVFVISFLACPVSCDPGQFRQFFPAWSGNLTLLRDNNCTAERDAYFADQRAPGYYNDIGSAFYLANCILDNMEEFKKVEMSVVSLLFGLLPSTFFLFGPTADEMALLALRRPILAILLAIPMPCLRIADGSSPGPVSLLRSPIDLPFRLGILASPPVWLKALVSILEYALASLSVVNMIYQAYQLAFWTITVSSIALYSGPLPATYGPFLWLMLIIVVHLLSFGASNLKYKKDRVRHRNQAKSWTGWLRSELTPCMHGEPMWLICGPRTYLQMATSSGVSIGALVLLVYATILLSSQIFISLGDALGVIVRFLLGALVCRTILAFELRGMREVTSEAVRDYEEIQFSVPRIDGETSLSNGIDTISRAASQDENRLED
ncbi:hypothetical protein F4805DRAFT_442640 [Annulohypoxylon moriforme]|nr:hypothetical protein F4805DRAFT_442640 [Annulohypoxylon moriforme]